MTDKRHHNTGRIMELDYLKCIFIVLMIIFHLAYFSDMYPYAKKIVYTFHMPAFFVISGFLLNVGKSTRTFLIGMLWIFIPYAIMELAYVVMSAVLPVREKVAEVTTEVLLQKTLLSPIGPYWYLHTLILCSVIYFAVYKIFARLNSTTRLIIMGLCFATISFGLHIVSFPNTMYFMAGAVICQSGLNFIGVFRPTALAAIPFVALCCFADNLDRATLAGVAITYLSINLALYLYQYTPQQVKYVSHFIGRNTLVILLFSPIFTILSKVLIPIFSFDPTGLSFMVVSVVFVVCGCVGIAWVMDRFHLSKFCFGRYRVLQ